MKSKNRNRRISFVARILIYGIEFYQMNISKYYEGVCIHEPSCSHYSREALETHGTIRGLQLTIRRLLRCRAQYEGGYDPVP